MGWDGNRADGSGAGQKLQREVVLPGAGFSAITGCISSICSSSICCTDCENKMANCAGKSRRGKTFAHRFNKKQKQYDVASTVA